MRILKKLRLALWLFVFLSVIAFGSEIWFRGFDLTSVSMDEIIDRESAELKTVEQGIKEALVSDILPDTPIGGLRVSLDVDRVTFETSILDLPVELEYSFYERELFYVKYRFYRGLITSQTHSEVAFSALSYQLSKKYGSPTDVGDGIVQFKQGDLLVVLEKLPSSSKLEISYIILPVVERIIDTKFHELVLELFGTTLVEVDDVF
ncbi:MAG: hypothetical protein GXX05_01405 [Firmicutes bacterium]|nr:hypothetical protein [Bacillota bacterium]